MMSLELVFFPTPWLSRKASPREQEGGLSFNPISLLGPRKGDS